MRQAVTPEMFASRYADVFKGDEHWQGIKVGAGRTYAWDTKSTYVQNPPYFEGMSMTPTAPAMSSTRACSASSAISITTDHISPAGSIKKVSPAGAYLTEHGVPQADFNSYGARRGNHEVMMRGTFANIRIKNQMVNNERRHRRRRRLDHPPSVRRAHVHLRRRHALSAGRPRTRHLRRQGIRHRLVARLGRQGHPLLGVRAVVAESFERIHRSNLIGMGVLPLQFIDGQSWAALGLTGAESVSIADVAQLRPAPEGYAAHHTPGRQDRRSQSPCRIDTENEVEYFRNGGILHYVLRGLARPA